MPGQSFGSSVFDAFTPPRILDLRFLFRIYHSLPILILCYREATLLQRLRSETKCYYS